MSMKTLFSNFRKGSAFRKSLQTAVFLILGLTPELVPATDPVSFRNAVAPLLIDNCVACHGTKKSEGGYRANTYELLKTAGDSGIAPIDFSNLSQSELLRRITSTDPDEQMPAGADPMSAAEVEVIKNWLEQGGTCDATPSSGSLFDIVPDPVYPAPPLTYSASIPITAIQFSENAEELLVSGYHELTIWRVSDGSLLRRIGNLGERIHRIAKLPSPNLVAVACGEPGRLGEVRVVNLETGSVEQVIHRATDLVLDLAVSPDSKRLATSSADGLVRVYNLNPLALHKTISSHSDYVTSVAWSPDGAKLATASRDKTAKVFEVESGELLATCSLHQQAVRSILFSADGKQLISSGSDNMLYRWDAESGVKVSEIGLNSEAYQPVTFEATVFFACSDQLVKQFDVAQNKILRSFSGHKTSVLSQALSPTTKLLATGSLDGEVRIWNISDGTLVVSFLAMPKQ